jgi:hypothetical protein
MTSILKVDSIQNAAGTAAMTIDSSGNLIISNSGSGVFYRTGTWTPVIVSGSGSYNGLTTSGTYTRIGNTVHVTARILITASGNASGSMKINNLPFNGYTPSGDRQVITAREDSQSGVMAMVLIDSGSTQGKIKFYNNTNATHTTNYDYIVTGTYQTNDA